MRAYLTNLFINRDYALFMGGSFISATGNWLLAVAIGWLVWEIGRSELLLGAANFAQMGPMLVLGLVGGALADRVERRRMIMGTQLFMILASSALAALAWTGMATTPTILALLLVVGVSQSFAWPSWSPFIADLVGPERLRAAIALNSARFNLTRIIGPAIAGVLLAQVGAGICLALAAVGQVFLIVTMGILRPRLQKRSEAEPLLLAIARGLRLTWSMRQVRETMLVSATIGVLILPYVVFLPAFAEKVLHAGPEGYGFLLTAVGAGAILGAAVSGTRAVASRPRRTQGVLAITTGLALAVFAASTWMALSAVAMFVVGLGSIGYMATANATVQLAVPRHMIGRVMGIWVVVSAGSTPIGGILLGWLAERVGLGVTVAVAGLAAALFAAVVAARPEQQPADLITGGSETPLD